MCALIPHMSMSYDTREMHLLEGDLELTGIPTDGDRIPQKGSPV